MHPDLTFSEDLLILNLSVRVAKVVSPIPIMESNEVLIFLKELLISY